MDLQARFIDGDIDEAIRNASIAILPWRNAERLVTSRPTVAVLRVRPQTGSAMENLGLNTPLGAGDLQALPPGVWLHTYVSSLGHASLTRSLEQLVTAFLTRLGKRLPPPS